MFESDKNEFSEHLVTINRVAKVVKGGRRFGFAAIMIVGDNKGRVGIGTGKAKEVPEAVRKATENAKTKMIRVHLKENRTIHHDIVGRFGAGKVILRAAAPGTGIIAGGPMRALFESLGMSYAANSINKIMERFNISLDAYDLYSCFPAAVKMFTKSLNLSSEIPKTITGSMPYAGGPLNSFVLHSTVKMIEKIRASEVKHGLVTGVSGMMTKQSFCVWGKGYQEKFVFDDVTEKAKLDESPIKLSNITEGEGEIIGYTVIEESENAQKAVLYLDDEKKHRKVVSSFDKSFINLLMEEEWVGKKIKFKDGQATP